MALKFALKIIKDRQTILSTRTSKKRRFIKILRSIKSEDHYPLVWIKVDYGRGLDVRGKLVRFTNIGEYQNWESLWYAFNVFAEET